ncbi:unnamed protein product, partial [Heterosigma akashiwo]
MNLLSNAVRYTFEGEVTLVVGPGDHLDLDEALASRPAEKSVSNAAAGT